jgi:hypothetical protein
MKSSGVLYMVASDLILKRWCAHRTRSSFRYHAAQPGNHTGLFSNAKSLDCPAPVVGNTIHCHPLSAVWHEQEPRHAILKSYESLGPLDRFSIIENVKNVPSEQEGIQYQTTEKLSSKITRFSRGVTFNQPQRT